MLALGLASVCPAQIAQRTEDVKGLYRDMLILGLQAQNEAVYAGDVDRPRPVPKITVPDIAADHVSAIRFAQVRGRRKLARSLAFAFQLEKYSTPSETVIPMRRDEAFALVRPGDAVILTDGKTPHQTQVFDVDRGKGTVYLVDAWPKQCFLLPGRNALDVEAKLCPASGHAGPDGYAVPKGPRRGKQLLAVTRADFEETCMAIVTVDRPQLIARFLAQRRDAEKDAALLFACGLTMLDWPNNTFVVDAVPLLRRAAAASRGRDAARHRRVLGRLKLGVTILGILDPEKRRDAEREIGKLNEELGEQADDAFDANDWFRVGLTHAHRGALRESIAAFDASIQRDDSHYEPYWARATARFQLRELSQAAEDAGLACELVEKKLKEARANPQLQGVGREGTRARAVESGLEQRLVRYLATRGQWLLRLHRFEAAIGVGRKFVACRPKIVQSHLLLATALFQFSGTLADDEKARKLKLLAEADAGMKRAIECEPDMRRRVLLTPQWRQIQAEYRRLAGDK